MSKENNEEKWKDIIATQASSGLTQVKWCQDNDVNLRNFRYWKNRLYSNINTKDNQEEKPTWTIITPSNKDTKESMQEISIRIGNAQLTIDNNVDKEALDKVVSVLIKYV